MTASEQLAQFAAGSKALPKLCREYKKERATVHLKELVGGALSFYAAAAVAKTGRFKAYSKLWVTNITAVTMKVVRLLWIKLFRR